MIRILVLVTLFLVASVLVSLAVQVASADDSDWSIHHNEYQDTVNLINLDGYQIEYWAGECVLRLGRSFTGTADTLTVRVSDAIPAYDLNPLAYPASIISCVSSPKYAAGYRYWNRTNPYR